VSLSIRDYEKVLGDKFRKVLQQGLASFNRLLFIGCGDTFNDPNFAALIDWMRNILKDASLQHYALVRNDQVAEKRADKRWSGFIDPVGYGPSYDDLPTFLDGIFSTNSHSEFRSGGTHEVRRVPSASQTGVDFEAVQAESIAREVAVGPRDLRELSKAVAEGVIDASANKVAELSQLLGMTQGAALAVLRSLGLRDDVPLNRLPGMLFAASTQVTALRQELGRTTNAKSEIAELRRKAATALDLGSFDEAVRLLDDVRIREREESERLHRSAAESRADWLAGLKEEAETCALIARALLAQGIVTNAQARFSEGIGLLAPVDPGSRWDFTVAAGQALYAFGERAGSIRSLEGAVNFYRLALADVQLEEGPLQWSLTQNNLATVLWTLSRWTTGTSRLDEAATTLRASLELISRHSEPRRWSLVQNNLACVLTAIGERKEEIPALNEALTRCQAALEVNTRDREPLGWALNSSTYAAALLALGKIDGKVHWPQDAAKVYSDVLTVYTQKEYPLEWAQTQNNLGNALWMIGRQTRKPASLNQAIAAFRSALVERTRESVPMNWATTQNNLGNALQSLGAIQRGKGLLEEAITAYNSALEERTRDRAPLLWAETQNNLGYALRVLGSRTRGTELLEQAIDAYRAALEERTPEGAFSACRETRENLAVALRALEERKRQRANREKALGNPRASRSRRPTA
jgi:tetratricopeptide (TPR) repeat protein